jgi:hypothetical protein
MNEENLKNLWKQTNENLEQILIMNNKNTQEIAKIKTHNTINKMKPIKIFALIIGILWVLGIGGFLANLWVKALDKVSIFFLVSATLQVIITGVAVGYYLYQMVLIQSINYDNPVFDIQESILKLKASSLQVARILFLQLPLWTTFYWNQAMIDNGNISLWILQIIVTGGLTFLAVWLFFNIKLENRDKSWFQWIFSGSEWQPIIQAMETLSEVKAYKSLS